MIWSSSMAMYGYDQGKYIKEKVQFPDGTEGTSIMFNDADIGNVNNGFTLVSTDPNPAPRTRILTFTFIPI